ncbi:helix-turn-helix domain-containing protein [Sphingopyxis sp. RIFCSPHIGHO2_12_FULL_65_19]|uniref:helix-turn-helix domain-containing protein n=1 Tax=Sphingopyxis sp. RIFCSPHIGHO2_12_FULL_65_19 TaxID=1802172 RepID=UPI0008D2F0A8|nr:helix-turn-helix transcriptional regulator [Sphingopyxis sp. RIFCSPHIGHO2_12_FULL_65_19]OHD05596.1 MAG: hypothetical protein A3E77_14990 [Sphingopyxis sp. RIFCSPHIGHO2_12_FULL_65_19]
MPAPSIHPFAEDQATKMLDRALALTKEKSGKNLTEVASAIGISKATLSHMAVGRAPIPIDRAHDLANHLNMEPRTFVMAVLNQRHPEAMAIVAGSELQSNGKQDRQLDWVLSRPVAELSDDQVTIIREVARDARPRERWLSVSEVPTVNAIRRLRPNGTTQDDFDGIEMALIANDVASAGTGDAA